MMVTHTLGVLIGCAGVVVALAAPAHAGSVTVMNDTALVAYSGYAPAAYFSGSNPYVGTTAIGSGFATSSLTVQAAPDIGGAVDVTFSYLSQFAGTQTVNGVEVAAADIFLAPGGGAFTYGISLGDQAQNGGVGAGFYQVGSAETSQQIWGGRSGFTYGGGVAPTTQFQPGQAGFSMTAMPTVITSGQYLSGAGIATIAVGQGWYNWNVSIEMTVSQAALFDQGFNVFWGTADYANGAFLANVSAHDVPEPPSAAIMLGGGLLVLALSRRRRVGHF